MGLFSSKPDTKPSPEEPRATPSQKSQPARSQNTETASTVVGKEATVKGELASTSDILVEGRVEGTIESKKQIVIGPTGWVRATLIAEIISVRGEVHGDCEGRKKVEITATGKVFGNITAEAIVVAEGATFRGSSKMTKVASSSAAPERVSPVTAESPPAQTSPSVTHSDKH